MALSNRQITWVVLQRMVFGAGVIWGFFPLISVPFLFLGGSDGLLADYALLLTCMTILPASLLAFWFRRTACFVLCAAALLDLCAVVFGRLIVPGHGNTALAFVVSSGLLALFALAAELFRWPPVLAATRNQS